MNLIPGVTRKYVTRAQIEELYKALGPSALAQCRDVEYYIVADDDPRVGGDALRTEA